MRAVFFTLEKGRGTRWSPLPKEGTMGKGWRWGRQVRSLAVE